MIEPAHCCARQPPAGLTTRARWVAVVAGVLMLAAAQAKGSSADAAVRAHLEAQAVALDPRALAAIDAIDDPGPQLLALRGYLRGAARLDERWSWSRTEIAAFEGSADQARVRDAVARVRCAFETANPGHTLVVNPVVRSVEAQILNWNANPSIQRAGDRLLAVARRSVAAPGFPRPGSPAAMREFRRMLLMHTPVPTPPLAPPGLSLHGQMRALDFLVKRGDRIVAGPDIARVPTAWHAAGWTARLAAAVDAADVGLEGPLRRPDEPWHYEFRKPLAAPATASRLPRQIGRLVADVNDPGSCRRG